jgi:hypothetical protein
MEPISRDVDIRLFRADVNKTLEEIRSDQVIVRSAFDREASKD